MYSVNLPAVGTVATAAELLKYETHSYKNVYNRIPAFLRVNTVDGQRDIYINVQSIVRGYNLDNESVQAFLEMKFEIVKDYRNLYDNVDTIGMVYVGDLKDIEPHLNTAVFMESEWYENLGTTFICSVKPEECGQAYHISEDNKKLQSKFSGQILYTHPEILKTLERVAANNGRIFVD